MAIQDGKLYAIHFGLAMNKIFQRICYWRKSCFRFSCLFAIFSTLPWLSGAQASYLHGQGGRLYNADNQLVRLGGVNWFGFETSNLNPHGLWARDYHGVLLQIKNLGFNCIRIPFCNAMFRDSAKAVSINFYGTDPVYPRAQTDLNKELQGKKPIEIMDEIIRYAGEIGLAVILDDHSREPDKYMEEKLWYTSMTSEKQWIDDWVMLASRYKNNPTVIGCDLDNEPHGKLTDGGSAWGTGDTTVDWNLAAQKCGNAILSVNPDVLIVIEGVEQVGSKTYWWGGNLEGVGNTPIVLTKPEKLVYSPHEYGPEVFQQPWFDSSSFPSNLEAVWDSAFGYIVKTNRAPLLVGEFGIKDTASFGGKSGTWFKAFIKYMAQQCISWTFWCFNPNSGDTGGLLEYDWVTVEQWKVDALKTYWSIPVYNDRQAPTALVLNPATVAENLPAGASVGVLSAIDPDSGEHFTYALVAGTGADDNAFFQIADSLLKTAQILKYNSKQARSILVKVTDREGLSFQQAFTIQVTPNNHAPSDISLSNASVNERCAPATVVGAFSVTDPDSGQSYSFALVPGVGSEGNGGFSIEGNMLKSAAALDHEATPVCSLRVRASDNGSPAMSIEKVFIITVNDVNEPPVIVSYTPVTDTVVLPLDTTILFTATPKDPETPAESLATGWFLDTAPSVMPLTLAAEGYHKLIYFASDGRTDTVKHSWVLDVRTRTLSVGDTLAIPIPANGVVRFTTGNGARVKITFLSGDYAGKTVRLSILPDTAVSALRPALVVVSIDAGITGAYSAQCEVGHDSIRAFDAFAVRDTQGTSWKLAQHSVDTAAHTVVTGFSSPVVLAVMDERYFLTDVARRRPTSALPSDLTLTVGMGRAGAPLRLRFGIPRKLDGKPLVICLHNFRGQSIFSFSQNQVRAGWFSSELGNGSTGSGIYTCTMRVGVRVKHCPVIISR